MAKKKDRSDKKSVDKKTANRKRGTAPKTKTKAKALKGAGQKPAPPVVDSRPMRIPNEIIAQLEVIRNEIDKLIKANSEIEPMFGWK